MNSAHDLGGMHGLGPINPEPEAAEPVFHAGWEKRVFGMVRAIGSLGLWSGDASRHARERQHPVDYLRHTYYENWLAGLEKVLVEKGLISAEELASGVARGPAPADIRQRRLEAQNVARAIAGSSVSMPLADPPRFQAGDWVRAVNNHPLGHTREPRYVRGRAGVIHEHHGGHVFPDLSAVGVRVGRPLYTVRFEAHELWGKEGEDRCAVYVDMWEDYLEPATTSRQNSGTASQARS
jgi:nitrile hydratase subunit beta